MRVVLQRVQSASVTVVGKVEGQINQGVLLLVGIEAADTEQDVEWLCRKIANMRIFNDADGLMNISLKEKGASALVISQFTLHASTKKGNRPSFIKAARPEHAKPLYALFKTRLSESIGTTVASGVFGAHMQVSLVNDGPVTIVLDSRNKE